MVMLDEGKPDTSFLSPTFSLWRYLASYGYHHGHISLAALQTATQHSRDAFLLLIAAGTLGILWMKRKERLHLDFAWCERLQNNKGIHPKWFVAFERLYTNDKYVLCAGGIIEAGQHTSPLLLSFYRQLNVPLCIHWGEISGHEAVTKGQYNETGTSIWKDKAWATYCDKAEALKDIFPSTKEFWKLFRGIREDPPSASTHSQFAPYQSHYHLPDSDSPKVKVNSGQHPGQSWQNFFVHRDKRNFTHQVAKEQCVGIGITAVASVFGHVSLVARRRVSGNASNAQKKYDGFSNTWDLCSEFGDFDPALDDDWEKDPPAENVGLSATNSELGDDEGSHDKEQGEDKEGVIEDDPPINNNIIISSGEALTAITGYIETEEEVLACFVPLTMAEVAYERYSFSDCEWERENIDPANLDTTQYLLGNGQWWNNPANTLFSEPDPGREILDKLCQFFHILLHTQTPMSFPSHNFSDPSSYIWDLLNWEICVIQVTINGEDWHLVHKKADLLSLKMVLHVKCPVSVLHIICCAWGPDLHVIASQLLRFGIRFHTLVYGKPPSQQLVWQ
ncbi:hypothetical protein E1B28_010580 [Marasmius oreades]|uniref:Uncharacterized protein n=1 Tax=Marasmius oreades TaxID=181124 RepID=A0A9P7RYL6_9AGAR|nr:uncharacterized protein E1B28_010580 [Marasmius oreades]KAG7091551.1 hypothetical protein E1B28_010580 [Marasmius oreades]